MKRTSKVLLPLGLCMSIVIPLTLRTLFTDSNFFRNDENVKIDYLQPYKVKPEASLNLPSSLSPNTNNIETSYGAQDIETSGKDRKPNTPKADISSEIDLQLQIELQDHYHSDNITSDTNR